MWRTSYAPNDPSDVNYTNTVSVQTGDNQATCTEGAVRQTPFLDDALRRLNFYRWLVGLQYATLDATYQVRA